MLANKEKFKILPIQNNKGKVVVILFRMCNLVCTACVCSLIKAKINSLCPVTVDKLTIRILQSRRVLNLQK